MLDDEARDEMLEGLGLGEGVVPRVARAAYHALGRRTFLTTGDTESRAWTFRAGAKAPECAGVIHSDLQRGFIRAEVIEWRELLEIGSWPKAKELGKLRVEGKDYVVVRRRRARDPLQRVTSWPGSCATATCSRPRRSPTRRASRRRGLLGRDGFEGALVLAPCRHVHTARMRFAIDVALCDARRPRAAHVHAVTLAGVAVAARIPPSSSRPKPGRSSAGGSGSTTSSSCVRDRPRRAATAGWYSSRLRSGTSVTLRRARSRRSATPT